MARKKRKAPVRKKKKSLRASTRKTTRGSKVRAQRKRRPQSLGNRVKRAYRTVVDTIRDTDRLRNKMEPPSTSETE